MGEIILITELQKEAALRQQYSQLEEFEQFTKGYGIRILQGEKVFRRSVCLGNARQVPMTLSYIARKLRQIEKEKKRTISLLQTDEGATPQERIPSVVKRRRTQGWLRQKNINRQSK